MRTTRAAARRRARDATDTTELPLALEGVIEHERDRDGRASQEESHKGPPTGAPPLPTRRVTRDLNKS
jgi:hypothetical protein